MTNPTNTIKIPNDSIITEFKEHLDLELNQRILFTAPFGAGKSTFINDFEDEHKDGYCFIRLYPVNYAVSANEDIFELIKFDILFELMAHHNEEIALKKDDFDFWLRMSMFMQNKADLMPLFLHIISLHETIGKPVTKFLEVVKPLVKDFKEYSKEINIDESGDVFGFLETFESKKGSPYEMDATSQFIFDLVDRLKGDKLPDQDKIEEDRKRTNKTVLVIDDLDRLDPDHIFRLFNIFSAHTHSISGENKFGFDKVVFVCDIENIRKIYAHKYGQGVDFSGYMDKFYSVKPFEFDNVAYVNEKIEDIVQRLVLEKACKNQNSIHIESISNEVKTLLIAILKIMMKYRLVNLRSLVCTRKISYMIDIDNEYDQKLFYSKEYLIIDVFYILKDMLGSWRDIEERLKLLEEDGSAIDLNKKFRDKFDFKNPNFGNELNILIKEVFRVLISYCKNSSSNSSSTRSVSIADTNLTIYFSSDITKDLLIQNIKNGSGSTYSDISHNINLHHLLYRVYKKIQEYGFIPKIN